MPEVRDLRGLVARDDAGEHETPYPCLVSGDREVGVADGVDLSGVLVPSCVAGGCGDDGIGTGHRRDQRVEVEHVAAGNFNALGLEPGRIRTGTHQCTHFLAAGKQFVDDLAAE